MIVPAKVAALAAGMFALALTMGVIVAGAQNTEASPMGCGTPNDSEPAGAPVARIDCTSVPAFEHTPGDGQFAELLQPRPSFAPPAQ